jgi:hypothetical protein
MRAFLYEICNTRAARMLQNLEKFMTPIFIIKIILRQKTIKIIWRGGYFLAKRLYFPPESSKSYAESWQL